MNAVFCCSLTSSWETEWLLHLLSVKVQCTKLRATSPLYPKISDPEFKCELPAHVLGKMCALWKAVKVCKQHMLLWKRKNKGQWGNDKKASSSDFFWALPAGAHTSLTPLSFTCSPTKSPAAESAASTHKCPVLMLWASCMIPLTQPLLIALSGLLCLVNICTQRCSL